MSSPAVTIRYCESDGALCLRPPAACCGGEHSGGWAAVAGLEGGLAESDSCCVTIRCPWRDAAAPVFAAVPPKSGESPADLEAWEPAAPLARISGFRDRVMPPEPPPPMGQREVRARFRVLLI